MPIRADVRAWTARFAAIAVGLIVTALSPTASAESAAPGSPDKPLRVMLIPADGGTEQGTIADFEPVFNAVSRTTGLRFDIRVGQSYNTVVQAMATRKVDIAFFGPVSFMMARDLGAAELLAVSATGGESVYYSGFFARRDRGIESLADLKGRSVAFGDVNSASSFNYPVAMLLEAGIDPVRDLKRIYLAGSHAASLEAMASGQADAAAASFASFEKAINNGTLDPERVRPVARSAPIPNPPLAMHPELPSDIKHRLREAFHHVHESPDIKPEMIRGYGGKQVDRYDAYFDEEAFVRAIRALDAVTDELKAEMLRKASQ